LVLQGFPAHFPFCRKRPVPVHFILDLEQASTMQLEFHHIDLRWKHLRVREPQRYRRLLASLAESGQQTPIIVVLSEGHSAGQTNPAYLVIDGYKRIAALRQLGRDTVDATVWAMSEAEALLLDRTLRLSQQETALEQGWLLLEMEQRYGHSIQDLARRFDRSESWVSRRLALVELLPEDLQQQVREGSIAAQLAMKYLVPVARISVEACQRMAATFAMHRWNTRQAGQLYRAWREGSQLVRERILAAPELFLKTQRQTEAPAATEAAALKRDLETATAIVQRANRRLATALTEMDGEQREQAQQQIAKARRELDRMAQQVEQEQKGKEETHAEPGTTRGDSGDAPARSEQTPDRTCIEAVAAQRTQSAALELQRGSAAAATGEGRTAPPADPRSIGAVQGQSRASP
jgi:ParB family chromosome partitioning protein